VSTPPWRLRPVDLPGDVDLALPWYADPEVMRSEGASQPLTRDQVTRMYEHLDREGSLWIIEVEVDGRWHAVGDASLHDSMMPLAIGDPQYRRRGIGRAVLGWIIEHARELGWTQLRAHEIYEDNIASLRLFRAAGFVEVSRTEREDGRTLLELRLDL
jgi:GNAT superfamily N-acetyltransferase